MALTKSSRRIFRALSVAGVSAAAFAGVLLASSEAHAQRYYYYSYGPPPPPRYGYAGPRPYYEQPYAFQLGFDLEGVLPLNPPSASNGQSAIGGGAGFKVRAGEQIRFPGGPVRLTPEVGYAYDHLWAADDLGNSYDWSMNRFFAGARLGFGRIVVPTLYAHIGYGWRQVSDDYVVGQPLNEGGLAFDVGGAIDFHLMPHVNFGAHLEYTQIALSTDTPQWLAVGGHIDFLF